MQSWGTSADWSYRGTESFPSRSGVFGGLFANIGVDRNTITDEYERIRDIKMTSYMYGNTVRRMTDFHMVHGIPKAKAPNKIPDNACVTNRVYLTNVTFGVILCGDDETIEWIVSGIKNPKWSFHLGRKACVPCEPVYSGVYNSNEDALNALNMRYSVTSNLYLTGELKSMDEGINPTKVQEECSFDEHTERIRDVPHGNRHFSSRFVKTYEYVA